MRKFKLIKEYPGCNCKLGDIVEESNDFDRDNSHYKFSEFWEEVIKKDYEILSVTNKSCSTSIIILREQYSEKDWEAIVRRSYIAIHSVKRLSDGEVFTIGDNTTLGKLSKIELVGLDKALNSGVALYFGEFNINNNQWDNQSDLCFRKFNKSNNPFSVEKIKQPLFTTEDGVDIYEGETFWYVNNIKQGHYLINKAMASSTNSISKKVEGILDFSTEEKAEEYIIMNKPCLSINDVINTFVISNNSIYELKQLVKQKIK